MRVELMRDPPPPAELPEMTAHHLDPITGEDEFAVASAGNGDVYVPPEQRNPQPIRPHGGKIGRNEACPCGSGKKYKHCHGVFEQA